MILTGKPNPSIDKAIPVPGFRLGDIHRPERVVAVAGGKGLNVSRTIKRLGSEGRACVLLAGHNRRWIEERLAGEGIPASIAWAERETCTCNSIIDPLRCR
jgi:1-phosphofructokinase